MYTDKEEIKEYNIISKIKKCKQIRVFNIVAMNSSLIIYLKCILYNQLKLNLKMHINKIRSPILISASQPSFRYSVISYKPHGINVKHN